MHVQLIGFSCITMKNMVFNSACYDFAWVVTLCWSRIECACDAEINQLAVHFQVENQPWKENGSFCFLLLCVCFRNAGLIWKVSEFASKKQNAALSARDHHTLAVAIAQRFLHGLIRFETILIIEVGAVDTNGESKRGIPFHITESTVSVLERRKGALNAKQYETHAPVGALNLPGPVLSGMTLIIEPVAAGIHGWSSHVFPTMPKLKCVVYALRKLRAALSVRGPVKPAAVGVFQERIPHGPCLSATIPTTVVEVATISGIWTVPQSSPLSSVQEIIHVGKIPKEKKNTFILTLERAVWLNDIL